MSGRRPTSPRSRPGDIDREACTRSETDFASLLDQALGQDIRSRRRPRLDIAPRVLGRLGFARFSLSERRAHRARRGGARLVQASVLLAAAVVGVAVHNFESGTVSVDRSLPHAIDQDLRRILPAGGPGALSPLWEGVPRLDDLPRSPRGFPFPESPTPAGPPSPEPEEEGPTAATAPYRWI